MNDSIHKKLSRVRKPRVHITYDVENSGSLETKELPFVTGVLGDYSGDNVDGKEPMRQREFTAIDRDNFNEVLSKINPQLSLKVDDTLSGEEGQSMKVNLDFKSIEDFEPHQIVNQVEPLRQLLETRNKLRDIMAKVDRSDELETILEDVLKNTEQLQSLSDQLGVNKKEGEE